jgi:hypothetical protein
VITDRSRPLPECALCQSPTQRRVHRRNGGMCTDCRTAYDQRGGEQQQLPLITDAPTPAPPDLTNVVVLDTRRPRPNGRR